MFEKQKQDEQRNKKFYGADYIENDYVFKWENGEPYNPNYITRKFSQLLEENDMPHIRFHDLRHSCASYLVSNGFQLKDIQEWLGHADIDTTANIYAHLYFDRKSQILTSLDLGVTEEDNEEYVFDIDIDSDEFKSNLRKKIRYTGYYIKENKLIFTLIIGACILVVLLFGIVRLLSMEKIYSEGESFKTNFLMWMLPVTV